MDLQVATWVNLRLRLIYFYFESTRVGKRVPHSLK